MTWRAILVLENTEQERAEISASLTEHGYEVLLGSNGGSDRLKVLGASQTDLIVLDAGNTWNSDPLLRATASYQDGRDFPSVRVADRLARTDDSSSPLPLLKDVVDRMQGVLPPEPPYRYQLLEVDFHRRRVLFDGREVLVTPREFGVLAHLARHAGKIQSVAEIFESVWGRPYTDDPSHLWTYIRRLRRKLEPDPSQPLYLLSRAGLGYFMPTGDAAER